MFRLIIINHNEQFIFFKLLSRMLESAGLMN